MHFFKEQYDKVTCKVCESRETLIILPYKPGGDIKAECSVCAQKYTIGKDVEKGELPDEPELLGQMVENISYYNARNYFGFYD